VEEISSKSNSSNEVGNQEEAREAEHVLMNLNHTEIEADFRGQNEIGP
jgi:hypothetical protein